MQQEHEAEAAVEKIEAKPPACSVQKVSTDNTAGGRRYWIELFLPSRLQQTGKLLVARDPMDILSVSSFAATITKRHFTVHYPGNWFGCGGQCRCSVMA